MNPGEIRTWLIARIAETQRLDPAEVDDRAPFDAYGLSSREAVVLSGDLEELLGRELSPTLVYEYPSIAALSDFLERTPGAMTRAGSPDVRAIDPSKAVAIIGIGCRVPGADDPASYWRLLRDGRDMIREVPGDRWDVGAFYDPDASVPGKSVSRFGGFLDQVDRFDPFFFGISPGEAERMDPQQRLLLELAYEAFEDAGYPMPRLAGSRTGVFVGISINEYAFLQFGRHELLNGHSGTGNALSIAANRLSYFFNLHGPSMAVDTACSSSLMAVHLACQSLRSSECQLAVAGGANVILSPAHSIAFTKAGVLAPDGRCKVFDARADGYVRGEGGGLVVLKTLTRALADGDPIYAVIRGGAVGQDGRTNGLMAPSREAQEEVLRAAYRDAEVPPGQVQYVEAHGTGTLLGDAIEARALGAVLALDRSRGPCAIGSVKSNLGHLEAAAGIAGLVKVTLALTHRAIPPTLHFSTPNPHVSFDDLGLQVQQALAPWPSLGGPALAGVSSFGFGGTDVHLVLEEAPERAATPAGSGNGSEPDQACLLPLSARTPEALRAVVRAHRDLLATPESDEWPSAQDVCVTAAIRRNHLDHRVALVGRSTRELGERLEGFLGGEPHANLITGPGTDGGGGKLAFVFSGQGSQWIGMGRELLRGGGVFPKAIERCDQALSREVDWSLLEQLNGDEERSRLADIDVVQPVLFAVQVALASLWRSWGIEPDAVVGHSMGEVAAAHVAGALTLEDAVRVICARSRLLKRLRGLGGMAVVGLSAEETARCLAGNEQITIAARNSPRSTVVAGQPTALTDLIATLARQDIFASLVNVDVASHSPQTLPLADELRQALAGVRAQPTTLSFVSTVGSASTDAIPLDADYWARNLAAPVDFTGAVQALLRSGHRTFLEISPHPVLLHSIQQTVIHSDSGAGGTALPSLERGEAEYARMLRSLGSLYVAGRSIDWTRVYRTPGRRVDLPRYPWQRQRYWIDAAGPEGSPRGSRPERRDGHPLLGERIALAQPPGAFVWQADLDPRHPAFLGDHRVQGEIVMPAAAYVEMALSAATAAGIADSHELDDLEIRRRLVISAMASETVQVVLSPEKEGRFTFGVHSRVAGTTTGEWALYATAVFNPTVLAHARQPDRTSLETLRQECNEAIHPEDLYRALATQGLNYGPLFRGVESLGRRDGEAIGHVKLPEPLRHESADCRIHPALLDAAMHVVAATQSITARADGATYVPVGCRKVRYYRRPGQSLWSHAKIRTGSASGDAEFEADLTLLDDDGDTIIEITGFRLARVAQVRPAPTPTETDTWIYDIEWRVAAAADTKAGEPSLDPGGRWIILADSSGLADALQQDLEARGQRCRLLSLDQAGEDPAGAVRRLLDDAATTGFSPLRGVVHLWSTASDPRTEPTPASLRAAQASGCDAALGLVQGLADHSGPFGTPRLWLVTRGVQSILPSDPVAVAQAPLWGLGKSIGFELPELHCTLVDLDTAMEPSGSNLLALQLARNDNEDQVAFRGGRRLVPRLVPHRLTDPRRCPTSAVGPFRADATYLVTGGLGALGLTVAAWMTRQGARHLVLAGRAGPSAASARAIEAMRQAGAEIVVIAADVADDSQVAQVVARIHAEMPPLRGVVHAAGVLDNAPVVSLDHERMSNVMAPKVEGAWNLHAATMADPLDFFVLFSSAVSVLGSPGQGNYAAANVFLDALAHYRHRRGLPAISINWGPWSEIGLAAAGNYVDQAGSSGSLGVKGIKPQRGVEILGQALEDGGAQLTVLPFDLASLLELYPTAAKIPFFAEVGGSETHVSRFYARPTLRHEYLAPRNDIERRLAELWRQTLRIDRVGVRDSFFELGGDSVLAAQIVTAAHRTFGVQIDLREAFEAFTIEHLARRVESALVARVEALSENEAARLLDE